MDLVNSVLWIIITALSLQTPLSDFFITTQLLPIIENSRTDFIEGFVNFLLPLIFLVQTIVLMILILKSLSKNLWSKKSY